jgi:metal-sulfur cluster biosynthetic enzyme
MNGSGEQQIRQIRFIFTVKNCPVPAGNRQYILKIDEIVKEKTQVTAEIQPWTIQRILNISNMAAWS